MNTSEVLHSESSHTPPPPRPFGFKDLDRSSYRMQVPPVDQMRLDGLYSNLETLCDDQSQYAYNDARGMGILATIDAPSAELLAEEDQTENVIKVIGLNNSYILSQTSGGIRLFEISKNQMMNTWIDHHSTRLEDFSLVDALDFAALDLSDAAYMPTEEKINNFFGEVNEVLSTSR